MSLPCIIHSKFLDNGWIKQWGEQMLLGVSAVSCVTIMSPEPFKTMLWAWVESGVTNIDSELPQWTYSCSKLKILWRSVSMINNNKCAMNTTVDMAFNVNLAEIFMQFCLLDWRFFLCFSGMFISPGCRPSVSPCLCRDRPLTDITITSISNMPQLDCSCQLWLNSGLDDENNINNIIFWLKFITNPRAAADREPSNV